MPIEIDMGRMIVLFEYPPKSNQYHQIAFNREQAWKLFHSVWDISGWEQKVSEPKLYKETYLLPESITEYYEALDESLIK